MYLEALEKNLSLKIQELNTALTFIKIELEAVETLEKATQAQGQSPNMDYYASVLQEEKTRLETKQLALLKERWLCVQKREVVQHTLLDQLELNGRPS